MFTASAWDLFKLFSNESLAWKYKWSKLLNKLQYTCCLHIKQFIRTTTAQVKFGTVQVNTSLYIYGAVIFIILNRINLEFNSHWFSIYPLILIKELSLAKIWGLKHLSLLHCYIYSLLSWTKLINNPKYIHPIAIYTVCCLELNW